MKNLASTMEEGLFLILLFSSANLFIITPRYKIWGLRPLDLNSRFYGIQIQ